MGNYRVRRAIVATREPMQLRPDVLVNYRKLAVPKIPKISRLCALSDQRSRRGGGKSVAITIEDEVRTFHLTILRATKAPNGAIDPADKHIVKDLYLGILGVETS